MNRLVALIAFVLLIGGSVGTATADPPSTLSGVDVVSSEPSVEELQTELLPEESQQARACQWPANTVAQGSRIEEAVTYEHQADGSTRFQWGVNQGVGVEIPGLNDPALYPAGAAVAESWIILYDEDQGQTIWNRSVSGSSRPSAPFANGCFHFRANAFTFPSEILTVGHTYEVDTYARWQIIKYSRNGEQFVETREDLATASGYLRFTR